MARSATVIGIDLGTTYTVVAHVGTTGLVTCLPNGQGDVLTPSCVWVTEQGGLEVGRAAADARLEHPSRVVDGFKRHMGATDWSWEVDGRRFSAEMLSGTVLRQVCEAAERIVGPIESAVITVPAYFGDRERTATLNAARRAGINVLSMINEPTAAALAGAFDAYINAGGDGRDATTAAIAATAPGINLVCDFGGGTLDVTVIHVNGNRFDVLATGGIRVGGRDFDAMLVEAMQRHLFTINAPDPHHDLRAQARMRVEAERAKHVLTVERTAVMPAPYPRYEPLVITRETFEGMCATLVTRARELLERVRVDAGVEWARVDDVQLVGGASRMPMFRRMLRELSGHELDTRLQPDLTVSMGAAVFAAILRIQKAQGVSASPTAPRVPAAPSKDRVAGERPVPGDGDSGDTAVALEPVDEEDVADPSARGSRKEALTLTVHAEAPERATAGESALDQHIAGDPLGQRTQVGDLLDPTFAAAAGAVRLTDVSSRSLGVIVRSPREQRKVNAIVIPRNSRLPVARFRVFATRYDNQRRVCIPVVEGEQRDRSDCTEIGRCLIDPLPDGLPKGARIQVTFRYDRSGRVHVHAEEASTHTATEAVFDRGAAVRTATNGAPAAKRAPTAPNPALDELAEAVTRVAPRGAPRKAEGRGG
jgi:molecular chaperone DnaK (HSP70)